MLGQKLKTSFRSCHGTMMCNVIFYSSEEELLAWKQQIGNCNHYVSPYGVAWYWWYEV